MTIDPHGPGAHSKFSASSAERWLNCPGSIAASAGMPDTSSPYADEGTTAHIIMEVALKNGWDAERAARAVAQNDAGVKADMVPAVQSCLTAVRSIDAIEMHVELRVRLMVVDPRCFATSDIVLIDRDRVLHVFDYKHGAGKPVYADNNPQLKYYGLGVALTLRPENITSVALHVVQPRYKGHVNPHMTWETDLIKLVEYGRELQTGIAVADMPGAPRVAGPWCQFCKAKKSPRCPESAGWSMRDYSTKGAAAQFTAIT